jgi:tetratricopeptide (TPR) repeat protein
MRADHNHNRANPPFAFLSRYIPLAVIAVLLIMLLPQLVRRPPASRDRTGPEPPVVLTLYRTERARMDSLSNEGLRSFGAEDWNNAIRLLGEAHFHYSVMINEGYADRYPEDLRFYLGLSHYYRGQVEKGVALLEGEAEDDPLEPKYRWYLALIRLAGGDSLAAREHLERVVRLGGDYSDEAGELLGNLPGVPE